MANLRNLAERVKNNKFWTYTNIAGRERLTKNDKNGIEIAHARTFYYRNKDEEAGARKIINYFPDYKTFKIAFEESTGEKI
tara:strand:+ start:340 stop:582 length:243 start_codon:yes stop_codon:yes gene_type:complete